MPFMMMPRHSLRLALILVPLLGFADSGFAQQRALPDSRQQITLSFAPLVKQTAPAVVNIYTRRVVQQRVSPLFDDPFFQRFFGQSNPLGMPRERVERSLGSGVIVAPDGLIVTNDHVVKDSDQITVVLADRREFEAKLVSTDNKTDLAILRIAPPKGERLPFLALHDSDDLEVGVGALLERVAFAENVIAFMERIDVFDEYVKIAQMRLVESARQTCGRERTGRTEMKLIAVVGDR